MSHHRGIYMLSGIKSGIIRLSKLTVRAYFDNVWLKSDQIFPIG